MVILELGSTSIDCGLNDTHWWIQYQCGRLLSLSNIGCAGSRTVVLVQVRHEISESCELFNRVHLSLGSSQNLSNRDSRSMNEVLQRNNSIQESLIDLLNRVSIDWLVDISLSSRLLDWHLTWWRLYLRLAHNGFLWQLV